ncbi:WD40-repeat-containing domain protein [Schizophyllum commune]
MSSPAGTPDAGATSPSASSTDGIPPMDRIIIEYLKARGHKQASETLLKELQEGGSSADKGALPETLSADDLLKAIAVYAHNPARPNDNVMNSSATVLQELSRMSNPASIQNLIASLGSVGAEEILSHEPSDKEEGFRELQNWVDGSLDMYRPQFRPILFPIFCHFYLDLIQHGFKDSAQRFFQKYSPSFQQTHHTTLHHFSTLLLPAHVQKDELAQQFRNVKYVIRMSNTAFGLLLGWLTDGVSGEAFGSGAGFNGEKGKRGRSAVMRVVNNHLKFDVTQSNNTAISWEENTGLLSSFIPQQRGAAVVYNPQAFNASKGQLKLGPAPMPEAQRAEVQRTLQEKAIVDPSAQAELQLLNQAPPPGLIAPTEADLPPRPPNFKTIDVEREVHRVQDQRRRIRLEPSTLGAMDVHSPQANAVRARVLPSICCYTLHDVPEGAPCATFSQDTSLMAAGFAESYVRLWSLNGEKLRGLRNDIPSHVKDSAGLKRAKEKKGSTTRKLIGHSGPVYSVDFDPLSGSAAPPKYLLSCSADATTRLWSMDTLTNVVAYRGHENPVWDVKWSPMGIYFATGSRDRTARLWSTDRVSCLRIYAGHLSDVDCVQFHPNGLYLATGSSDWTARLWDVQKGSTVRVFIGHQGNLSALAMSPDGRYLASAGEDLAINLWDLGSGKRIKKMTGHTSSIYSLAFSGESSMLVSGGADWTVRCWDVKAAGGYAPKMANGIAEGEKKGHGEEQSIETTDLLSTFPTKRTPITNVQFTPRNLCLVAGNYMSPDTR